MFTEAELAQLEAEVRSQLRELSSDELTSKQRFRAGLDADQDHALRNRRLPNPANALLEFRGGLSSSALLWAREFTLEFLGEIRHAICRTHSGKRRGLVSALTARSAATGLASWLGASFAVSNPVALALATFVLLLISSSAVSAFCTMTDDEVRKRLLPAPAD
jgi:hypothetical protein